MKLVPILSMVLLWIDRVSSIFLRTAPTANESLSGPAHKDTFQEEILDQADPEFDMASFGDNCINLTDAEQAVKESWQEGAMARKNSGEAAANATNETQEELLADVKMLFEHAIKKRWWTRLAKMNLSSQ
mmetsp:Transcript_43280/g.69210  ORF Transcript_43280/g.69210 Transcript_43280/m.69210 type:complete len:130 (+) Transcript_43280:57-446(+)